MVATVIVQVMAQWLEINVVVMACGMAIAANIKVCYFLDMMLFIVCTDY